ncbi:hypothetical protein G6011_09730 [Alternaria panax]|uniref:Uncharacterized protein n=1 Tax=Alternaria panax TaxID=48097 RepID=A0AAD4FAS8_9PLEO|nr:hypothetical protein G6011_09730 [Alternaria panax]
MPPPLNSQDDRAAFIDACIDKRKKAIHVWESLGLISRKLDIQHGDFAKDLANELQGEIEGIAKSFAMSYRGNLDELHSDLGNVDAFSDDILRLGQEYGAKIWGRLEDGEIRSSGESQGKGIEEHDWNDSRDRKK